MKKVKYHILFARILMICFMAGQGMIYAHSHAASLATKSGFTFSKSSAHQTVQEKCYLCDVMHHNTMVITGQVFLDATPVSAHLFNVLRYKFSNGRFAYSSSRAPPFFKFES